MQGNPRIVEVLNDYLTMELTAVNIYFTHSRMLSNWGLEHLAEKFREISFSEMKDTEALVDRVLFLEGVPNVARLNPVTLGENPREALEIGARVEREALEFLNRSVKTCVEEGDEATREFLAAAIPDEEAHLDWLETQLDLLGRVGEPHYLAAQIRE